MTIKTVKLASLKADLAREEAGEAIPIPEWPGVKLFVRSVETESFRIKMQQLQKRLAKLYQGKDIPPLEMDAEQGRLFADELLRGWEGFDEPYSPEIAATMLPLPEWRDLRNNTLWAANRVGARDVEFVEQAIKN